MIAAGFGGDFSRGNNREGFWYDWAFVRILLDEAEGLMAAGLPTEPDPEKPLR